MRGAVRLAAALLLAAGGALAQEPPASLPGWANDRQAEALVPLRAACAQLTAQPPAPSPLAAPLPAGFLALCPQAMALPAGDHAAARRFFESRFVVRRLGEGLLTGYFEPELRGSPTPGSRHPTPLHARPPELVDAEALGLPPQPGGRRFGVLREGRLEPMPDRAAIQAGALAGRGLELAWVDPVDAFFLHIQGSGRILLTDGRVVRLGYAGQNGHPYFAIGQTLVQRGVLTREQVSLQSVRDWLRQAPPREAAALMARNTSYIFFRELDLPPEAGPIGTLGVPVTPMRSVAVDRAHVPLGLPVWIAGTDPLTGLPLERLTIAQDTGGAIRGPARADLFTGWDAEAAERAGRMRLPAALFVLVPR
jgi:membrane-bound lytic murein transglycosylase A